MTGESVKKVKMWMRTILSNGQAIISEEKDFEIDKDNEVYLPSIIDITQRYLTADMWIMVEGQDGSVTRIHFKR